MGEINLFLSFTWCSLFNSTLRLRNLGRDSRPFEKVGAERLRCGDLETTVLKGPK